MKLSLTLPGDSYDILIERGALSRAGALFSLSRRVMIVTDDGVPPQYAQTLAAQCKAPYIVTVPQGEKSKNLATLETVLRRLLDAGFDRGDCVVAVGGGMVGDLAGLAASLYMRGIGFYNVPTTVLAQVDSSVGGKTAVDLAGIKNVIGTFYQPRGVLIDPNVLTTLPSRQVSAGLAEAVKIALTCDPDLFALLESQPPEAHWEEILFGALRCKAAVVEQDEKEQGLRRILNFGHTIGHAIESCEGLHGLLHGECVALGMLPMCSEPVRYQLEKVLAKLSLPVRCHIRPDDLLQAVLHDKKMRGGAVTVTTVPEIGRWEMREVAPQELLPLLGVIAEGGE